MKKITVIIAVIFLTMFLTGGKPMADKNIQMGQRNETNTEWDKHYPITKAENVLTESGTVASQLAEITNTTAFNPIVVAREKGRHLAFGAITRVADLASASALNVNLVVYRSGESHQARGKIKGVFVSDTAHPIGEPFMIADPDNMPTGGRNGTPALSDFRDPGVLRLPDGKILLTFMASEYDQNNNLIAAESYAMIGVWDNTHRTLIWGEPVVQFLSQGNYIYGKPFIEGDYIYTSIWTDGLEDGLTRCYVVRSTLLNPTAFTIIGDAIYEEVAYICSEAILRPRPGGGYFLQVRYETAGVDKIIRYDADTIDGAWSQPVTIYEGSSHAKGLEILEDGSYFTGIRFLGERPGVGILTSDGSAANPVQLKLSAIVYTSQTGSPEGSYMEFEKINDEEYLGMFHTESGRTIQCFRFTLAMIKDKRVKESEAAFPIQQSIGSERLNPLLHIGNYASRSHNLLVNPTFHIPYGFPQAPGWSDSTISKSDGLETDSPGAGYGKVTTGGGAITSQIKLPYSRIFENQPMVAAVRIYCKSPNRVRVLLTYGGTRESAYHSGNGWETLTVVYKGATYYSVESTGNKDNPIFFQVSTKSGDSITYFLDWATLGFGETIPEVVNDSAERIMSLARVTLSAKTTTFNLANLGFPAASHQGAYVINILDSNFEILGYSVTKTKNDFTITLTDGSAWGSGKTVNIEIIGG